MANQVTTVNQAIVNTSKDEKTIGQNNAIVLKKVYSKERFQIKNSGDLLDRPMRKEINPEQMEMIASTREKLQYKKNSTYRLVQDYVVDFKWVQKTDDKGKPTGEKEKEPLNSEDYFRVGIYAVPQEHVLV